MKREKTQTRQLNIRIEDSIYDTIKDFNISEFVRDAIMEKVKRDKEIIRCPTCKGVGLIRKETSK